MSRQKILLIGAGAAGSVFIKKWAKETWFRETSLHVASRTLSKCQSLLDDSAVPFTISQLDADKTDDVIALLKQEAPTLVVNLALPYQDLSIMDACLATGTHYLDTANYEPPNEAKFCYKWQWDYHDRFKKAGLMAILGCGFDPGVTNIYTAYAAQNHFDTIETLDILDCNAGDHGHAFATNFNPEINIREITQRGKYYDSGKWIETDPLKEKRTFDFPEVGPKDAYLMYHEELESLTKHFPTLKRARFWMTFSESYLTHLSVLENIGMTGIQPIQHQGQEIAPIEFLKSLLPDPASLAQNYTGKTCIGCLISGKKDGRQTEIFIYNVSDHRKCYQEVGSQAISYTTGVPALLGAKLLLTQAWAGDGVFNVEQLDPTPFMNEIGRFGLPWQIQEH